ncbi:lysophospholipid acyltransferase family protein [Skermania piniformis]|uniref:1-acyl-sn-glycerol-3-phosphate acyltransferase n=1 Tax=Skermania pinensis TaxID=39122 RepID=A0ABX8S7E3_9ACTN|nr:1-acyl-sn-glycerol-3-phosphate acyltransferase [Skermania piniformis]QXQ13747.1 1-acyl-sn-glycerol-3-phosphate acyltransferase [Skermania piniformis]
MDRPEVTLENSDAVYDFYRDHRQNVLKSRLSYAILARRYRPRVGGAVGAAAAIRRALQAGQRLIVVANHLSEQDPYVVAATAWRSRLRPAIGHARVLAKDELFVDPRLRDKVEMMGGIPVFRGKDHGIRAVAAAGQQMMTISAERMQRGDHLAIFPEGTCNDVDPTRVQSVGSGIGHIVVRARKLGVTPVLIPLGISYGPDNVAPTTRTATENASCWLGHPVTELPPRPTEIARLVREVLQDAVDGAVKAA